MKLYDYFVYYFYKLKKNGNINAIIPFCFFQGVNLLSLYGLLWILFKRDFLKLNILLYVLVCLLIFSFNYTYLFILVNFRS